MERRKFLIGAGSLAAGGAAALGSGAFTSVEANRAMSVSVAGDEAASLGLIPNGSSEFVYKNSGELIVELDDVNESATTVVDPAFTLQNNLSDTIYTFLFNPWRNNDLDTAPKTDGAYPADMGPLNGGPSGEKGVDVQFVGLQSSGKPGALIDRTKEVGYNNFATAEDNATMRNNMTNSSYESFTDEDSVGYVEIGSGETVEVAVRVIVDGDEFDGSLDVTNDDFIAYATKDEADLSGIGIDSQNVIDASGVGNDGGTGT